MARRSSLWVKSMEMGKRVVARPTPCKVAGVCGISAARSAELTT
jgi:hypothetical protein